MQAPTLHKEDRFGLMVTGGIHVVLFLIFLLYTFTIDSNVRPSFIEVQFGEFKTGTPAKYAEQKNKNVATSPNPSEVKQEKPQPKKPKPVEQQKTTTQKTTKPVDVPDQKQDVKEEKVKTPETDKVDPKKQTAKKQQKDVVVPPKTEEDEVQKQGAKTSGDKKGNTGELNADQGTGNQQKKSAPYDLKWEGDIQRTPMVQPLPTNTTDHEATISIKFEVKPDGSIGRIIPLKKMNPELEREVMHTLRGWRFSQLPSGVPQQSQWGTITFHFVLD
ncbi:MAG TPA: energy transducer TonB [Balneolaceae bacterium]|nr:energy transducer TonB [Balneolaceae bacterium]